MVPVPLGTMLVLDDEPALMTALCNTLETEGYSTTGFTSPRAGLAALQQRTFDLVLSDLMMPEMDGIAFLNAALKIDPAMVGILMTGHGTIDTAVQAMQSGALDYILKPFKLNAILPVISRALAVRRLRLDNIQLQEAVGIYKLSSAIAFASELDTVLRKVSDAVMSQTRVRAMSILLPSSDGADLHVAAVRGAGAPGTLGERFPFDAALQDWLDRRSQLLAREEELSGEQLPLIPPLSGTSAGVSVPMLSGGTFVGVINFTSAAPNNMIATGQVKALKILAGAAASAIEGACLLEKLGQAEQRYRRLAENAPDIVFRYDLQPQPCFAYMSPVVQEITGYSAEQFYRDPELCLKMAHPEDRWLMEKLLGGNPEAAAVPLRCLHRNGKLIWLEHRVALAHDPDGRLLTVEGIARDVTERKALEEQLRHSQKMEAVGVLAGGVAHDFNNVLTVIGGNAHLMLIEDNPSPSIVEKVDQIVKAADHAAALTRQLLAFGRKQVSQPKLLDLNTVIEDALKILRRLVGEGIEIIADLQPRLGLIYADPGQMEQILLNLAVNSRDAMPEGGRLTIRTRHAGERVILIVSDTGCGIDAATQSRIFEPFFTTKELGKGTGLGLSIVYGAVKQNNGNIRLISEPGKGATFEIDLPRAEHWHSFSREESIPLGPAPVGAETILVVEDDAAVRRLIAADLRTSGYRVLQASDGEEALKLSQEAKEPIALVVTDVVMPLLSGTKLVDKLRETDAGMKFLYTSGYPDHPALGNCQRDSKIAFLQKPFRPEQLLEMVRKVLDGTWRGEDDSPGGGVSV